MTPSDARAQSLLFAFLAGVALVICAIRLKHADFVAESWSAFGAVVSGSSGVVFWRISIGWKP
jgi:hypothetical protein